jgi:anti-sigma B factor antagonist
VLGVDAKLSLHAGNVVVALRGDFDVSRADGLRALVAPAASGSRIIVDLAEVAYMDCGSLRELAAFRAQARQAGGDLALAGPQPIVLRLLVITDMISRCQVFASVREAISGAAGAPSVPVRPEAAGGAAASPAGSRILA